ncbi:unnamed protein product [Didymodactylos carnosus]|uniref:Uncharacterized protein n=1 Tax=Didymodactylos carnosus TaxID=1234261 RepID=A0A814CC04_9BILA|nr:unnamed protein product [Didymodactylos carnosus]CAF0938012.1 unnamed protein product [Didymodactylos carnosus]CAF3518248.1 unnamed protein product [Didymodactylos carnosus]CAF3714896.1 unnamed protein product [Didymodactylos carnosus]
MRRNATLTKIPFNYDKLNNLYALLQVLKQKTYVSDLESSSGDDGSHAGDISQPPQIKSLLAYAPDTSNIDLWNITCKAIGKDLLRVTMPVILNEPLDLLQNLCEEMKY